MTAWLLNSNYVLLAESQVQRYNEKIKCDGFRQFDNYCMRNSPLNMELICFTPIFSLLILMFAEN